MVIAKAEFRLFLSETIGTAVLLFAGLSIVIFNFGKGSPVPDWIPSEPIRTVLTGFLFGCVGCIIALSPVGKISGAHINPSVSLAFWLRGKMNVGTLVGYIISQLAGAVVGCLPLVIWGEQGRSIRYSLTTPGPAGANAAVLAEIFATACLIFYLYIFVGNKKLRNYTPYGIPLLYSLLNLLVAGISGDSTNPARSFGPAVLNNDYADLWIYWVGPFLGVVIITLFFRLVRLHRHYWMEAARISYHNNPTLKSLKTGELAEDPA